MLPTPPRDLRTPGRQGMGRVFGPGTPTSELIKYIEEWAAQHVAV